MPQSIACPHCNKSYTFKPQLAGKKVRCKCGAKFRVPSDVQGNVELIEAPQSEDGYDLDIPADEPTSTKSPSISAAQLALSGAGDDDGSPNQCPACGGKVKPSAVICINCGFNIAQGTKMTTQVATDGDATPASPVAGKSKPGKALTGTAAAAHAAVADKSKRQAEMAAEIANEHKFKNIILPLMLVGIALVLTGFNSFLLSGMADRASLSIPIWAVVRLIIQLPIMLVGIIVVAKLFGTSFGPIGTALLKLTAIVMFAGALDDMVSLIMAMTVGGIGFLIEISLSFGVFFVVCTWILETEPIETMVLWFLTKIVPWILLILIGMLFLNALMP